jgi:hypothetical protein
VSAALTLAKPEHLDKITTLAAAFHAEEGIEMSDEARRAGLAPLLDGIPHGAAYLIGPPRAPIGYIVVCFVWTPSLTNCSSAQVCVDAGLPLKP